jgi:hypothetical protein
MKPSRKSAHSGFITTLLIILAALIILGYFKINLQQIFSSPDVQANLQYAWQLLVSGVTAAWNYVMSLAQTLVH